MKFIIVGAGELGCLLASTLLERKHDVILLDNSPEELERVSSKLDVMTVEGSCSSVAALKEAGAESADTLFAVSGDEAANILACQIASRLGVKNTICRLYRSDAFSEEDGIGASTFGIWRTFSPPEVCAVKIADVLACEILLEKIHFSSREAQMAVIEIERSSILAGVPIKDIPGSSDILQSIRFAAILRGQDVLAPHGDTILAPGDKVYVAGKRENVDEFLQWLMPSSSGFLRRLVISGSDETGRILAHRALEAGFEVRFIEPDLKKCEELQDLFPSSIMMLNGDPTEEEILEEAGVGAADVFVNVSPDDENNILSCILAKRMGARKVISLTHKPEYVKIVPALEMIDCAFSATLVSVNSILRLLDGGAMRVDAILQRFRANLSEFRISARSPLCGKRLGDCRLPPSLILALVFRNGEVLTPSGSTVLEKDDVAVAIVAQEGIREIEALFPK